jgi:hypothetical protein
MHSQPALLMTESREDYVALQASLEHEIMPRSFLESMYVADIAALMKFSACVGVRQGLSTTRLTKHCRISCDHSSPDMNAMLRKILRGAGSPVQTPRRKFQRYYGKLD